jgi:hypothetical protein
MPGKNDNALDDMILEFIEALAAKWKAIDLFSNDVPVVTMTSNKWTRINRGSSAYCFIARQDFETKELGKVKYGDIHMPHNYKAPAKHARGSILADDRGMSCCERYSVKYLR